MTARTRATKTELEEGIKWMEYAAETHRHLIKCWMARGYRTNPHDDTNYIAKSQNAINEIEALIGWMEFELSFHQ